jgi:hypothetical protein
LVSVIAVAATAAAHHSSIIVVIMIMMIMMIVMVVIIVMVVTGQHQRIHDEPAHVVANRTSVPDCGPEVDAAVDARVVRLVCRLRESLVLPRHEGSGVAPCA